MSFFGQPACTDLRDERAAVDEIRRQLATYELKAVLIFVAEGYDLKRLSVELRDAFSVPVFGCTTAGNIGPRGYRKRGIQAIGLGGSSIAVHVETIHPLDQCQASVLRAGRRIEAIPREAGCHRFGLLFVDGLSRMEERLAAALHHCLPDIPLIGGSAGDNLNFNSTFVYTAGHFIGNAAVFAVFETDLPFTPFKLQHFEPTDRVLVVTEADAERRVVYEFNGEPAARAYAEMLGLSVEDLNPAVFSRAPVLLKLGEDHYVRSIQRCNDDLSLTFYCAIAKGIVLRLGRAIGPVESFEKALASVKRKVVDPSLIIGCDCILRRLEFEQTGMMQEVERLLSRNHVVGFSTYGEQYNALHMNQTFTGLAIGGVE